MWKIEHARDAPSSIPTPGVGYHTFLGLVWGGAALSLLSVLLRLYSRFRGPRRLFLDDMSIILAETLVITTAGLWQWAAKFMFYILEAESGHAVPGPQILPDLRHWLDVQLIAEIFFYTTLLLVKLSFLLFFRRLGQNVEGQKYLWWPVLVFSVIVYVISMADIQYKCYGKDLEVVETFCTSAVANNFTMATLRANMAMDVFSDFLIIAIPIKLLWAVQLAPRKKLAFIGLFSLSVVTMVIAIVRAVAVNSSRMGVGQDDATFLWLWSSIQAPLAVIISCLSAFPQLFKASSSRKKPVWTPTASYYERIISRWKRSSENNHSLSAISRLGSSETEHARVRGDSGATSSDSQRQWLAPAGVLQKSAVVSYGHHSNENKEPPPGNQIQQQMEYHITRHPAPSRTTVHNECDMV